MPNNNSITIRNHSNTNKTEITFRLRHISEFFRDAILWFMVAIYPLMIIPNFMNPITVPRFWVLFGLSLISLSVLFTKKIQLPYKVYAPLGAFVLMAFISTLIAPDQNTAWLGLAGPIAYCSRK